MNYILKYIINKDHSRARLTANIKKTKEFIFYILYYSLLNIFYIILFIIKYILYIILFIIKYILDIIFRGYYMGQTILHYILHTFEPYCTSAIAR